MARRIVLLMLAAGLLGCGKGNFSKAARAGQEGVLRTCISTNPTTLDPALVRDVDTGDLLRNIYEGLVQWGENNRLEPLLAERWEVTDAGKTYIFHLKHGVKFHNGREVHADDFKWSFERNCNPKLSSTAKDYLGDIVGVSEVLVGKRPDISGVAAVDPYTLKISIDKPRAYFIGKLTYPVASVLAKETTPATEIKGISSAIGTGPFSLASYVPNQTANLKAFADYHGGAPKAAGVLVTVMTDAATRMNKYKSNDLDFLFLTQQDLAAVQADPSLRSELRDRQSAALTYLGLNAGAYPPFKDKRVRQAFACAIDRQTLVKRAVSGVGTLANGILPPTMPGYRGNRIDNVFDPAAASELVASAGYEKKSLPPLELLTTAQSPDRRIVAEDVVTQLKMNLGIDVKVQLLETRAFFDKAVHKKAPFFIGSWYADYLDPENFLSVNLASYGQNRVSYDNPEFTKLCQQADSETDEAKRIALYQKAEDLAINDAVWIPLYNPVSHYVVRPWVTGLRTNAFGVMPYTTASVSARKD